ncbi:hypothetical protein KC19_VG001200 [Ceratodon purpureus]|uniref:Uncharacterized protein n=1 Tax=Ceratodon purpureus TaxID=3225 RepID=A0A8T0HKF2_CERPU|nr:hypothetical protein KC19_6G225000 [Ceratodon purpureus]KAG0571312.1 hypothetical protein KC19_VG001200 [Ceratodon purpureus]
MDSQPLNADVDAACFMMDIRDLPQMFGELIRPAIHLSFLRDLNHFKQWIIIISDPVIVKLYGGDTIEERQHYKRLICRELRRKHGLTLTIAEHDLILSKSRVNIPLQALVESLWTCGHRECRVGFYGMKWAYEKAKPKIDRCIQLHGSLRAGSVRGSRQNMFDIGVKLHATEVNIFGYGESQRWPGRIFRKGRVHEMFNIPDFGSIDFGIRDHPVIGTIKIYQELTHEVLSHIPKASLDDYPATVRTMRIRWYQLDSLLRAWEGYGEDELRENLLGTRIEVSIKNVHTVTEAYNYCIIYDLLTIRGLEKMLGGPFNVRTIPVNEILTDFSNKLNRFARKVRGRDETRTTDQMLAALTEARQSIGWSGKNMDAQLKKARWWRGRHDRNRGAGEDRQFHYDGWEADEPRLRPMIQDFLDSVEWYNHSASRTYDPHPIYLKKARGSGFLQQRGRYTDRVGAARWYVGRYQERWRNEVRTRPGT